MEFQIEIKGSVNLDKNIIKYNNVIVPESKFLWLNVKIINEKMIYSGLLFDQGELVKFFSNTKRYFKYKNKIVRVEKSNFTKMIEHVKYISVNLKSLKVAEHTHEILSTKKFISVVTEYTL